MSDPKGYTLVEVMLFIALTSFLLLVAVSNITAAQRNVQFAQSVRDLESRVGDLINDVPTGFFPTNSTIGCRVLGSGPDIYISAGEELGSNENCLHVGKALQFSPDGNDDKLLVYTLAGRRLSSNDSPVLNIDEAEPVAVAKPLDLSFNDVVTEITLGNGVEFGRIFNADVSPPTASSSFGIIGIVTNFEGTTPTNKVSEGQSVQIGGILGSTQGVAKSNAVNRINTLSSANFVTAEGGMVICLTDGGNRKASLTIGSKGSGGVRLDIDDYNVGCN